ncbi:MAG TPA: ComEC/Rec2 family competence protein [Candidatus Saccharimonadales bacterium]|nr:ComEC/Rec2 family competence protein [Candidatus Saccharimonadales bacterium]
MKKYGAFILMFCFFILHFYVVCGRDVLICKAPDSPEATGIFASIRNSATKNIRKYIPSPHSELLLGMLLGIDDLKTIPRFSDMLRSTGTIHIVVVSGYNISLVFELIISVIGTQYKLKNLVIAQILTLVYSLLTGFQPPVIRAWIMSSIVSWGRYSGRRIEALQVLIFSALAMLCFNPLYLLSLSFQLSFLATLSLVLYAEAFSKLFSKKLRNKALIADLSTTLAAQVLVWPLISSYFGRISLISPFVNCLILWTVPLATVLGGIFLITTYVNSILAHLFVWIVYPPLDIFVQVIRFFSKFNFAVVDYKISTLALLIYYFFVLSFSYFYKISVDDK